MKSLTIRVTNEIVLGLDQEARKRKVSRSDVARERLARPNEPVVAADWNDTLARVVGAVDGLPHGDSRNIKAALKSAGYGRKNSR